MAEVIHDGVFIFHAATVVCLAEVLDLPCLVYFLRHGVIEVTIKQKNILVIESRLTKFCGYVLLSTLGLREDNDLLWNSLFLLVIKYYPNIVELSEDEVAKQAPFGAKWRLLAQVEVRCYILISNISGSVKVAPLQILQFPVILPHKFQDAEKFNLQFSDFSEITETADKLRWLRYQKGLRQRDVADYAGIYRSTYIHYEEYGKDFYSPKHMERIAQLFEVPVERLLDDYNLFLRNGQGKQIKAIRMKLGLTQREYADKLGISLCNLKQWEQNRKQLFKSTWEKYFK